MVYNEENINTQPESGSAGLMTFGIVGYGPFGKTFAAVLAQHAKVRVYSRRRLTASDLPFGITQSSLSDLAQSDVIILANELQQLAHDCRALAPHINSSTIIMDVCSVKLMPTQILIDELENKCQLLATHPLFGPQSVDGTSVAGKQVVWHEISEYDFSELKSFFTDKLGLTVRVMSPDDHDREMAWVHALTFFIGRGLLNINPPQSELATNYYQQLRKLHDIESGHSLELFRTIQLANPYAQKIRQHFLQALEDIEADLESKAL
jgi:prephenate dehydrogenase